MRLMMDDTRRAVLAAELRDALTRLERVDAERERLDVERQRLSNGIAYLSDRLGIPEPANARFSLTAVGTTRSSGTASLGAPIPPPTLPSSPPAGETQPSVEQPPSALVREGEFSSLSSTEAAAAVLRRAGSPLTTAELYDAVLKGGVKVKDRGTLYRSMYRVDRITRVGKALWGLKEWHFENGQGNQTAESVQTEAAPLNEEDVSVPEHAERLDGVVA